MAKYMMPPDWYFQNREKVKKDDPVRTFIKMQAMLERMEEVKKKKEEDKKKETKPPANPLTEKKFSLLTVMLIIVGLFPLYGYPVFHAWKLTFELFTK